MEKKISKFGSYAVNAFYNRMFIGAIISGDFAKGKTSTAIQLATQILQFIYNYDLNTAYKEALNCILFTLEDVLNATEILGKEEDWTSLDYKEVLKKKYALRKPVLIWDDAGVHGSSLKQIFYKTDALDLQMNYDTIRDITSCMIMTVPENEELMGFLRKYRSNYFIELIGVSGGNKYNRILAFYKYERRPKDGKRVRRLKWTTKKPFSVYLPNWVYGEYDRRRTIAKIKANEEQKKKKKMREAKAKYYETRQKYFLLKMERELKEMNIGKNIDLDY